MGEMTTEKLQNLNKVVLMDGENKAIAPVSTTNAVYDAETAKTVEELILELRQNQVTVYRTKVQILEVLYDNQFIFELDYPTENFSVEDFPFVVIKNDLPVDQSYYRVNENDGFKDQLIFNTEKMGFFNAGETIPIIYHYSETVYAGGTVNANLVNNMNILWDLPEPGTEIPDPSVIFDFKNGEIIYYVGGQYYHFPIGQQPIQRHSKTITDNTQSVLVDIDGFNMLEDTLLIFENNVFIPMNTYYKLNEDLTITKTDNTLWEASSYEPITFDFLVIKKSTGVIGGSEKNSSVMAVIRDYSIDEKKLSPALQQKIEEVSQAASNIGDITNANNITVDVISDEGQLTPTKLQDTIEELYRRIRQLESLNNIEGV